MNEKNKGKEVIANATSGNNTNINNNSNNKDHKDMRKKLMRVMLIVVGVLVLFLVVLLLIAIIGGGKMDYEDIEQEMKDAAIEYYDVQKGLLPEEEGETVTVRARTLANAELMKPLDELREHLKELEKKAQIKADNSDKGDSPNEENNSNKADNSNVILESTNESANEVANVTKEIIVHCHSGLRSYIACRILKENGFKVKNLIGGYVMYDIVKNYASI